MEHKEFPEQEEDSTPIFELNFTSDRQEPDKPLIRELPFEEEIPVEEEMPVEEEPILTLSRKIPPSSRRSFRWRKSPSPRRNPSRNPGKQKIFLKRRSSP